MNKVRDRAGALGGIGYVALSGAGWALFERLGHSAQPWWHAARLAAYFHLHQTDIRIAAALFSLALGPYLVFLARLRLNLESRSDQPGMKTASNTLIGGSIAGAVIPFVFMTFFWGMAYRPNAISPQITQACFDLCILTGPAGFALWVAMLWAAAYLILKGGLLPKWLGYGAIAAGATQFLYIGDGFTDRGFFNGNAGSLGVYACYGGYMAWILAAGITWAAGWRADPRSTLGTASGDSVSEGSLAGAEASSDHSLAKPVSAVR
jgi:hypothetical protein